VTFIFRINYITRLQSSSAEATQTDIDSLRAMRRRLEAGIKAHYERLESIHPELPDDDLVPSPNAQDDPILLPSGVALVDRSGPVLNHLASIEAKLRIGYAHDLIERIKRKLSYASLLTRKSRDVQGVQASTRAQQIIKSSQNEEKLDAQTYNRNYSALEKLQVPQHDLFGLQSLDEQSDLTMLSTWLEDELYKTRGVRLPWIWTLSTPTQNMEVTGNQSNTQMEDWNAEGP
jgi:hypothetical protein